MTVTARAAPPSPRTRTIALALAGTATKGDDYNISAESLTLTLLAGKMSVMATVTAVQDSSDEPMTRRC